MSVKINKGQMSELSENIAKALEMTAEEILTDVKRSQVLPYREGYLTSHTFTDLTKSRSGKVSVVSSTPYARRLYYHPEYMFNKKHNRFAGGLWFEPYKQGRKRWVALTFAKFLEFNNG